MKNYYEKKKSDISIKIWIFQNGLKIHKKNKIKQWYKIGSKDQCQCKKKKSSIEKCIANYTYYFFLA